MVTVALVTLAQVEPVHLEDGREVPGADQVVLDVQHAGGGRGETAVRRAGVSKSCSSGRGQTSK